MTHKLTKIAAIAVTCCCITANAARAEDQDYNLNYNQSQTAKANDQQYKLPQYYQGKYYPDDEAAISYHGTSNTAALENQKVLDGNGYYYNYY